MLNRFEIMTHEQLVAIAYRDNGRVQYGAEAEEAEAAYEELDRRLALSPGSQRVQQAMVERAARGLALAVYGLEGRPEAAGPFTCFARDEAQKAAWIAKYEAQPGVRVEVRQP